MVAVGMRTNSPVMGIIAARERRAGGMWKDCKCAPGSVSMLWTRCGVLLHDLAEVSAILAPCASAGPAWHGALPKTAPRLPPLQCAAVRPEQGVQAAIGDGCGALGDALAWVYGATIVEQRCIFHKRRNVAEKCREELKGEAKNEARTLPMEQAGATYQAERAEEARRR